MDSKELKSLLARRAAMIYNCYSPSSPAYTSYSSRGITVYQQWQDSEQEFIGWCMANGYKKNYYLNRKNKDEGFNPDNCYWSEYGPSNKDIEGLTFGRLKVVRCTGESFGESLLWECICSCGTQVVVPGGSLRSGNTKSCGCYREERKRSSEFFNGRSSNPLYKRWRGILQRCYNPKTTWFKYYGGRGITVCDEWRDSSTGLSCFSAWAAVSGFKENLEIDRIDVNGNYSPENCRWVTKEQNSNNKRNNLYIEYGGETYSVAQFARKLGVTYYKVLHKYEQGKTGDEIFNAIIRAEMKNHPHILNGVRVTVSELVNKYPGLTASFVYYHTQRGRSTEEIIEYARSRGRIK